MIFRFKKKKKNENIYSGKILPLEKRKRKLAPEFKVARNCTCSQLTI